MKISNKILIIITKEGKIIVIILQEMVRKEKEN